tara:strand:- start:1693 stop:2064 length:372 start_codon:yes stop_codon:yes gene_type:complete
MLTFEQTNALGNILNTTWGKGNKSTFQCKGIVQGENLVVTYSTMAYFASERSMPSQMPRLIEESNHHINELMSKTRGEFKDLTGETLKLEEVSNTDNLEYTQGSMVNPRRVAVYRRRVVFKVG